MAEPPQNTLLASPLDPGIGEKFSRPTRRSINHDGTFNVRRRGREYDPDPYQWLVSMRWWPFMGLLVGYFVAINALFALAYLSLGNGQLRGIAPAEFERDFPEAFFFSVQTFTSVGYGHIYPQSTAAGLVSSAEALVGLLSFALMTGLLYGRFSRPTARILFSRTAIVGRRPDSGLPCLQFRLANRRDNILVELQARVLAKFTVPGTNNHRYAALKLERDSVYFFPLNWTLVHDISEDSPLYNLTPDDFAALGLEILILVKGYDDTFAQDVHARNSYTHREIEWYRRFQRAYTVADDGVPEINLDELHNTEPLDG